MYIWRKRATTDWIGKQGDQISGRFGGAVAFTERPGKTRTLVEIFFKRLSGAPGSLKRRYNLPSLRLIRSDKQINR